MIYHYVSIIFLALSLCCDNIFAGCGASTACNMVEKYTILESYVVQPSSPKLAPENDSDIFQNIDYPRMPRFRSQTSDSLMLNSTENNWQRDTHRPDHDLLHAIENNDATRVSRLIIYGASHRLYPNPMAAEEALERMYNNGQHQIASLFAELHKRDAKAAKRRRRQLSHKTH